jgi:glycosyltransferase involved in cell wall biosynthesis
MEQRNVLYVAKTARGGSAISLSYLVDGLDHERFRPTVLFYAQEHPYVGDRLAKAGVRVITLEKKEQQRTLTAPALSAGHRDIGGWLEAHVGRTAKEAYIFLKSCYRFVRWEVHRIWFLVRTIRDNKIDLVHTNTGLCHDKAGLVAAWLTGKPCLCHVRMFETLGPFDKFFIRFVDTFIYISRAVAENYVAQGIPPAKGVVVHNAVDLSEFAADVDMIPVRREFGWTANERLVGIVGRLDWWKGHACFLEAMAEVAQQTPGLRGLIIGESENTPKNREYYENLQSLTRSLGLGDKVIFTGFRDDVARLMCVLDVVVLSSSAPEPFGRVVIEGMAAGKPVVATKAGGVLDIVEDGVNGLLVPPGDPRAMAAAILSLLTDPERARCLAKAGQQRVREGFTVQQHVAAVQGVYDAIMERLEG